jgi:ABC-type transport system involved in multi-copper enzyme maturation permease subunit
MSEMVRRFLHQRFGNPGLVLGLSAIAILTTISFMTGKGGTGFLALLLLTPGVIARDVSSGTAQMILARPIRRSEYVLGRYFGVLAAYALFLAVALLLALIAKPFLSTLFGSPSAIGVGQMIGVAGADGLDGALFVATLLFFSTFLPGFGDLLAYFLLQIGLTVMLGLGRLSPGLGRFATIARENIFPAVDWPGVFRGESAFSASTGRFVLALTVFLLGALFLFSRREFSYGQD